MRLGKEIVSPLNKIETATVDIDHRINRYSYPLYSNVIKACQLNPEISHRAEATLRTALRIGRFADKYFETDDQDFLSEAYRLEGELYANLPNASSDLENIKIKILKFFETEKKVWEKIQSGQKVTDKEIEEFRLGKSSDTFYYGRILKEFMSRDITPAIYADMQLMDILTDIQEYEADKKEKNPNLLYMILSQYVPLDKIPEDQTKTVQLARKLGIHKKLIQKAEFIMKDMRNFDYTGIEFLTDATDGRLSAIGKELGENPVD